MDTVHQLAQGPCIFQQENAGPHTSRSTWQWLYGPWNWGLRMAFTVSRFQSHWNSLWDIISRHLQSQMCGGSQTSFDTFGMHYPQISYSDLFLASVAEVCRICSRNYAHRMLTIYIYNAHTINIHMYITRLQYVCTINQRICMVALLQ